MRYPPNQKKTTHERVLSEASRMFRERGYRGTGVGAVMRASGMTAGGFYAHFSSKEALFLESLAAAFRDFRRRLLAEVRRRSASPDQLIREYFDAQSDEDPGAGCPIPALAAEAARSSSAVRKTFERELQETAAALAARLVDPKGESEETALALLALGAGGVLLSRAVENREVAKSILEACLRRAI
jgi:TetR/AcrR family transcriptional repressor of nem operon